jgi:hypothetical protein
MRFCIDNRGKFDYARRPGSEAAPGGGNITGSVGKIGAGGKNGIKPTIFVTETYALTPFSVTAPSVIKEQTG